MTRKPLIALLLAASAGTASAYDPIVERRGWPQVAYDEDQDCEGEVRGNGQIFYIYAVGLGSGTRANYYLTNGDMKPIDWQVRADSDGEFARYYMPFRWHRRGDGVSITITTQDCQLDLQFDWKRGYVMIEPDGTRHLVDDAVSPTFDAN